MKLYICWTLFAMPGKRGHPCTYAYDMLVECGYEPEVIKSFGWKLLPKPFNLSKGRQLARELTDKDDVPLLLLDDGSWIQGSREIGKWAREHPAVAVSPE